MISRPLCLAALPAFLVLGGCSDGDSVAEGVVDTSASASPGLLGPLDPTGRVGPNVVLIVFDDVGVDLFNAYAEAPVSAPCTPVMDAFFQNGLVFRNAWSDPVCSPTRAQIMTGRHGFRTGIGDVCRANGTAAGLPVEEVILPEVLRGYTSAALGKWHLSHPTDTGNGQGVFHPNNSGFDYFAGHIFNFFQGPIACSPNCPPPGCTGTYDYYNWVKAVNGVEICSSLYATTDTTDEAISAVRSLPAPWFVFVGYNAVHLPTQAPPAHLCPGLGTCICPLGGPSTLADETKEMVEALDKELGRLLNAIHVEDPDAYVILMSDNGSEGVASEGGTGDCFDPARAKGTVYEAGIRIPLVIQGPGVPAAELTSLVSAVDVFATIVELSGASYPTEDSVSLVPYLRGETAPLRETVYSERFFPNTTPPVPLWHLRAVRNEHFKLIRILESDGSEFDELYDLLADPCETTNLVPTLQGTQEDDNYQALVAELVALGVD